MLFIVGMVYSIDDVQSSYYDHDFVDKSNLECGVFNFTSSYVTERQYRISFSSNSSLSLANSNAAQLFRLKTSGNFLDQEMRYNDHQGYYVQQNSVYYLFFELSQEGQTNFSFYCANHTLKQHSENVEPFSRSPRFSVFQNNGNAINVCMNNSKLLVSTSSYINKWKGNIVKYSPYNVKKPFINIVNQSKANLIQKGVILKYSSPSGISFVRDIIIASYLNRNTGNTVYVQGISNSSSFESKMIKGAATKEYYSLSKTLLSNMFCWNSLNLNSKSVDIDKLTSAMLDNIRKDTTKKVKPASYRTVIHVPFKEESGPQNLLDIKLKIGSTSGIKFDYFKNSSIEEKVSSLVQAKRFITFDDNNELYFSIFMPPNSSVLVIKRNSGEMDSNVLRMLKKNNRSIYTISGTNQQKNGQYTVNITEIISFLEE